MKLTNHTNIQLISYATVNKEEVKEIYLSWMNNIDIVQYFGSLTFLFPKDETFIDESFKRFTNNNKCVGFFIYDTDTKSFIGTCKLDHISLINRSAEIGIMIGEQSAHGKGYSKTVFRLLMKYAFEAIGLHRIWVTLYANNPAPKRLVESIGLTYEGTLRKATFRNGKYIDNLRYAILREEYLDLYRKE